MTAIGPGWTIGVSQDNGKPMTVVTNGVAGGGILLPRTLGADGPIALAGNYENAVLQFDGTNFRLLHMTPQSTDKLGALIVSGTPTSSSAPCQTAEIAEDSNYLYACTAPSTWKRAALSTF